MGRIRSPGKYIARPAWYDRNPVQRADSYLASDLAPHTETTRLTYTVPSGKKAMIEEISGRVLRTAAATTLGRARAKIALTPSGGSMKVLVEAKILKNTVGDTDVQGFPASMTLLAGDRLDLITDDMSTGGTCDFHLSYKITEFDA